MRNRASLDLWGDRKPDWWGETIADVCLKRGQYSCHADHNKAKLEAVTLNDSVFQECMLAALCVVKGWTPDPTCGATHYQVVGTGASWSRGRTPVCTIGNHEFYVGIEPGDPNHKKA